MALSVNAKAYNADSYALNSVVYIGPLKTVSVLDNLSMKRIAPKPTATLSGVGHTEMKLERTLTLTGALTPTGVGRVTINVDVPVGFAPADVDSLLNDTGAFLASATFKTHVKSQQITF